jgi:hypothetical protein
MTERGALELGAKAVSGFRRDAGADDRLGRQEPFLAFAATPVPMAVSAIGPVAELDSETR